KVDQAIAGGPFAATWASLRGYEVPRWYLDGKFGIFIHWGVYAVPAFGNEWYPRNMYQRDHPEYKHHLETYGPHTDFGYKDFIPAFTAEKFSPTAWAELFADAGARFVVPVAEHHDGFAMYDCGFSDWTAVKMGPKRDIIGELAAAVREKGMVFGLSSHRAEHYWYFDGGNTFPSDVQDPQYADFYGPAAPHPEDHHDFSAAPPTPEFLDDWLARTCELVDKYHPQLVWFDWWIGNLAFEPYLKRFAAYYYNQGATWDKGVAINYKYEAYPEGTAVLDVERGQLSEIRPEFWQTDTSVSRNSWGYIRDHNYKSVTDIVHDLIDMVSKNGALLLNIGPRPDGTIPEPEVEMLREIGRWLGINGEAIYGTRPWRTFGEGPTEVPSGAFTDTKREAFTGQDIRFTKKDDALYATVLAWPGKRLTVKSLAGEEITGVELLGHTGTLSWSVDGEGLHVLMPPERPCDHAFVLRIAGNDVP
ncbi:MAG: alpha-L-fucosidase, partial [Anaerolineae bacterium]